MKHSIRSKFQQFLDSEPYFWILITMLFFILIAGMSSCSTFQHSLVLAEPYHIVECRPALDKVTEDTVFVCKIQSRLNPDYFSFVTFQQVPTDSVLVFNKIISLDHR